MSKSVDEWIVSVQRARAREGNYGAFRRLTNLAQGLRPEVDVETATRHANAILKAMDGMDQAKVRELVALTMREAVNYSEHGGVR